MNRRATRLGALAGAAALSPLAVAPAFAATTVSHASAQSVVLSIAGNSAVSQELTATNDGTTATTSDRSTVPVLATLVEGNNAIAAGVAPQKAGANADGTSYACAGLAGPQGGIAQVGDASCSLDGDALTLGLGTLDLDLKNLLGAGALTGALKGPLSALTLPVGTALDDVITELTGALGATPLGSVGITGSLSAVEATCVADPDRATGDANILNAGGQGAAIAVTIPDPRGGTISLPLATLPLNPDVDEKVVLHPEGLTDKLLSENGAIHQELTNLLGGAIAGVGDAVVKALLVPLQGQVVVALTNALRPALAAIEDNLLSITLNHQVSSEGGRKIEVTAMDVQVLPAARQLMGSSLVSGQIGKVSCGPNSRVSAPPATSIPADHTPSNGGGPATIPTVVAAGEAGEQSNAARNVLLAMGALLMLGGAAGAAGYRRLLQR